MKMGHAFWAAAICGAAALPAAVRADSITLNGTIRDFKRGDQTGGHPDFETCHTVAGHGDYGQCIDMITYQLGTDLKPIFNPPRGPATTACTRPRPSPSGTTTRRASI